MSGDHASAFSDTTWMLRAAVRMRVSFAQSWRPWPMSVYESASAVSIPWRSTPASTFCLRSISWSALPSARTSGSDPVEYGRKEKPTSGQSRLRSTPLPL